MLGCEFHSQAGLASPKEKVIEVQSFIDKDWDLPVKLHKAEIKNDSTLSILRIEMLKKSNHEFLRCKNVKLVCFLDGTKGCH